MSNLIKQMKDQIAKSGSAKKEVMFFSPDSVKRVRFLQDLDEGFMFQFHNDYNAGIYEPCKDPEDHESCELCKDQISIIENYVWSVWDYDSSSVRLICIKASGVSPIPAFIEMFEEFGTITDRDYKIKKVGKGTGGSFVITPLDKERFKNAKAKPYTEIEVKKILEDSFVSKVNDDDDDDEDDEDDNDSKKKNKKKINKKKDSADSVRERYEDLDFDELKDIALSIGYTKKEVKSFDDEEELIDDLFDNYEIDDLEDMLDEEDED